MTGMNPELRERITSAAVALCESARVLIANIRQDASGGFEAEKTKDIESHKQV